MKKTWQKTIWLFYIAFAVTSCSKDVENIDNSNGNGDSHLLIESTVDGKIKARYDYDNQNRLVALHTYNAEGAQETTITYMYDNNERLTRVEMINVSGEIEYNETYNYEDGNRPVSSRTIFGQDTENPLTTTYTYSTNKLVEKVSIPGDYSSETHYMTDNKGNLLRIETFTDGQELTTIEFGNYDDKKAPGRSSNPYSWKFNSPNNHRSEKATATYVAGNYERALKYIYASHDYPEKMEIYNQADNTLIETHTYLYKKAN